MQSNPAQRLGASCISRIGLALAILCLVVRPIAAQMRQPTASRSMADELKVSRSAQLPRATAAGPITSRRQQAPQAVAPKAAPAETNTDDAAAGTAEGVETAAAAPVNIFAKSFDDPAPQPTAAIDAAAFGGVQPGETSAEELAQKWGLGKIVTSAGGERVLQFAVEKFQHVEVTLTDGKVRTIIVHLDQPAAIAPLAKQLQLDDVRPVIVRDDTGELLGQAYPERGVLFALMPDGKRVMHIVLEKVDVEAFVLRAENDLHAHTKSALVDLNYVLSHQPQHARALWLRSQVYMSSARYDDALVDIDAALAVEPSDPNYRLTRAELLGLHGDYEVAGQETKALLSADNLSEEMKAKTLLQLGDLLAASPAHDYKMAMEHHLSAIKTADPLSIDKHPAIRRVAKQILIDAHLGAANDIACGYWQQKDGAVTKWLDRANAYGEDFVTHEEGDPATRLRVARGALAACAGAQGKVDSIPWARMALQYGKPLIAGADDPWTKLALQWELGLALADGLAADDFRGATQHALANTALTITYLEAGAKNRLETPDDAYRVGVLYFRQGSLYAVRLNDHKTAIAWYEKAFPILDRPIPLTRRNEQGRYGEWLVSMGLSYWEVGQRDFAMQLTDAGMQHVQEAVDRKLVDPKVLAVPYGNLAAMHKALGNKDEAHDYAELAAKSEALGTVKR